MKKIQPSTHQQNSHKATDKDTPGQSTLEAHCEPAPRSRSNSSLDAFACLEDTLSSSSESNGESNIHLELKQFIDRYSVSLGDNTILSSSPSASFTTLESPSELPNHSIETKRENETTTLKQSVKPRKYTSQNDLGSDSDSEVKSWCHCC